MTIGIIGLGSIGIRHVKILKSLGVDNIVALRSENGNKNKLPEELSFIHNVYSYEDFMQKNVDGIIISNPTAYHLQTLQKITNQNTPIFIEKPIDSNKDLVFDPLLDNRNIIVGYPFRFSRIYNDIKELIPKTIGDVFLISFKRSHYLPFWQPNNDYKNQYTAKKSQGGGVLLTLCHELDFCINFIDEEIVKVDGYAEKLSNLEIDTDDIAFYSCKFKNGTRLNFEYDFYNPEYINHSRFVGNNGVISLDFKKGTIEVLNNNLERIEQSFSLTEEIDYMYREQMIDFLNWIKTGKTKNTNLKQARNSMKVLFEILSN